MKGMTFDQERVHLNLARLKRGGDTFEVVIDPDKAILYKEGKIESVSEVLHAEKVFFDAKKGQITSAEELEKVFNTANPLEVAAIILKEGEVQFTHEHREKKREEKRRKILEIIHINAIDPKTGLPHPLTRLENAFAEAKIHIDENKRAEDQVKDILDKLCPIIPIKFDIKIIDVRIPATYATKLYGIVKNYGKIKKEEWLNDGSWKVAIEIPAGLQNEFFDDLNARTHGSVDVKVQR
jgi:ribosome maturation protein SDO1